MRIAVIGTGYVGLVAGTCFAETGNQVICVDKDAAKVDMLRAGRIPIYEPGLEELVRRNVTEERLSFTTDLDAAVKQSLILFIAVGTPAGEDGSSDLSAVIAVAKAVGRAMDGYRILVDKSTVPVGTAEKVAAAVRSETDHPFDVVSNPEFLKEGAAIDDFMKPDRVVVGCSDPRVAEIMKELYAPFVRTGKPILIMDVASAEMTKYAANAMLAARISFMNEIALLCERVGARVDQVRQGVGFDSRIGPAFLFPGLGYGGSCLHGRETALVRRRGRTRLLPLSRLFEEHAPPSARDDGEPAAGAVRPDGLEVLAWRPGAERAEFLPVAALTRRPFEGDLVEVRTKMGRRVLCTPDHPFVVRDADGTATEVRTAEALTTEDWLPVAGGPSRADGDVPAMRFDLAAAASGLGIAKGEVIVRPAAAALDSHDSRSLATALRPLGRARAAERPFDILRAGALRLDEAEAAGVRLDGATLGTARNGTYVPREIVADSRFWSVVGLYLAEGHCSSDGRRMRLAWSFHPTAEPDLVEEVAGWWRSLGVTVAVRRHTTTTQVSLSSRLLATWWLRGLGLGKDAYDHRVPDAAWDLPTEHRRALLRGLWRGDGSWSAVGGGPSVVLEYGTVSRALADGVLRLLADEGVVARLKVGRTSKSTVDTYWITVSGAERVERLLHLVGDADRVEIAALLARASKRIAPTGSRREGEAVSRVRVVSTTRRPFRGFVYSMEVPGAETFVTTGGLVVHNCFPKDVKALLRTADAAGLELHVVKAAEAANERQKRVMFEKVRAHFGDTLAGRTIAVWGLSFKPRTDDMREAPSIPLISSLLEAGAKVRAADPEALKEARRVFGDRITYCQKPYDALQGADALALVTEWNEFRHPDFDRVKSLLKEPVIFDGRNIYAQRNLAAQGFRYYGIGV